MLALRGGGAGWKASRSCSWLEARPRARASSGGKAGDQRDNNKTRFQRCSVTYRSVREVDSVIARRSAQSRL